jgi:hypothetical protein
VGDIGGDMTDDKAEVDEVAGVVILLTRPKSPMQMQMLGPALVELSTGGEEGAVWARHGSQRPKSMLPCLGGVEAGVDLQSSSTRKKILAGLRSR